MSNGNSKNVKKHPKMMIYHECWWIQIHISRWLQGIRTIVTQFHDPWIMGFRSRVLVYHKIWSLQIWIFTVTMFSNLNSDRWKFQIWILLEKLFSFTSVRPNPKIWCPNYQCSSSYTQINSVMTSLVFIWSPCTTVQIQYCTGAPIL